MKIIALLAVLTVCGATAFAAELPRKAPELTVPLFGASSVKISDYHGKVVVLAFILTT